MKYIQINLAGEFEKFLPNVITPWDENNLCTPEALVKDEKADEFGVVAIEEVPRPAYDAGIEFVAEVDPVKVNGLWTQQLAVLPLSAEQIEEIRLASIPQEVTMGQCRLALFDHYDIETDEEFLALADLLPEDQRARARLELRTRTSVRRDSPLVIGLGAAKGWDLDELFTYAAGL